MNYPSMDELLGLGSQAGHPPAPNDRPPASKTPEQPPNDSSSISELEKQLQELQLKRSQMLLTDRRARRSIAKCRQEHASLGFPEPPKALRDVQTAIGDLRSRQKADGMRPLTRDENRLIRKYFTQEQDAEIEYLASYVPHWQACQSCNP